MSRGDVRRAAGALYLLLAFALRSHDAAAISSSAANFFTVPSCRAVDTRLAPGPLGGPALAPGETRLFPLAGACGIPATAVAVTANVTVTDETASGFVRVYAADVSEPSTMSVSFLPSEARAGYGVHPVAADGFATLAVHNVSTGTIQFILDVTGYFDAGCPIVSVQPASLPGAVVGMPVSQTLTGSGGTGPYTFSVTAGALSAGLSLSPAGLLSGAPTASGTATFAVTAQDANGCTGSRAYSLAVTCQSITVSPTTLADGQKGQPYGPITFTQNGGTGSVTWSTTGTVPPGLTLTTGGVFSGTPTQPGTFSFTVRATDANGCIGSQSFVFNVTCETITVTNPGVSTGTAGTPFSQTFTQSGGVGATTFSLASGTLPSGLALASNGTLSGTPTQTGSFPITVKATDANGCFGTGATYTLVISCGTITVTNPGVTTGTTGTPFSQTFTQTGGAGAVTFTLASGTLPSGLTLAANGTLSGTPTQTGSFSITVKATDANGCSGTGATYTLVIACGAITVTNPGVTTGTAGTPFSQTFTQSGGVGAVTFSTASALPTGLTLAGNGTLSGTPTQTGSFPIVVTATDSNGCSGAGATYTLVISCQTYSVQPAGVPQGTVNVAYPAFAFTQSGGIGTVTFATASTLPNGMALASNGTLSGTPTQTGVFPITVTATDANGCTASRDYLLVVACASTPITLSPSSLPTVPANAPFPTTQFTASGGTGPYTFQKVGALPAGMTFVTDTLSGTPTQTGTFPITVVATDSGGCSGSQDYVVTVTCTGVTITIAPPTLSSGTVGTAYPPVTFVPSGGTGPYVLAEAGALPAGMSFSGGVLSGTPTQVGTFPITVTATDANGCTGQTAYSLVIACQTITVTNPSTTTATEGTAFDQTFTQSGAIGATTWSTASTLPTGLTLNSSTGHLSGTPTQTGTFPIVVKATDSNGCFGTGATYTLVITCPTITVSGSIPALTYTTAMAPTTFTQSGTGAAVTWSATGLPAGLGINASTGQVTGTPTATGSFSVTITATDAGGCTGSKNLTVTVAPKLVGDSYSAVGNTQSYVTGVGGAPTTPSVVYLSSVLANDTADVTISVSAGTFATTGGGSVTIDSSGRFVYTPAVNFTGADTFVYTGTANTVSATATVTWNVSNRVWWVDNATSALTNDGRSNTPLKTMTALGGASTNNGDFIYVAKGSGTTTGAYAMKPSQQLIGAGATLNVPTVSPLVTIAGVDGNTPTIGGTLTLAGNVTVAGIDLSTDASSGIAGTSVSGVTVTVRNVATTTGTGVTIGGSGNSGTFLFRSISSNGAVNGISLTNTAGSFTVTGDGASDPTDTTRGRTTAKLGGGSVTLGSGGTIQGTTGSAVVLNNAAAVVLQDMTIFNPSAGSQAVNSGANGITATSVNGLTLDNVLITGFTGNSGLRGIPAGTAASITNLVLQHVDINGNGTTVGTETNNNWNVRIDELAGNCGNGTAGCGWNNSLFYNSRENVFFLTQGVTNTTISTSMTITNCEFRDTTTFASPANDAFGISAFNSAVTNVTATGSTFKNVEVGGFQYGGNDNSSGIVNVRNSIFENTGSDVLLAHGGGSGGNSTLTFDVSGNTTRQLTGNPSSSVSMNVFLGGASGASSQMIGTIKNNTIGNAAVSGSGSHIGDGIDVNATGAGTITATVTGNVVRQIHQGEVFFGEANSGSAKLNLFIHNNIFNTDTGTSAFGLDALDLTGGAVGTDTSTVCADVGVNTLVGDNNYTSVVVQTLGAATSGVNLLGLSATFDDNTTAIANFMGSSGATTPPGVNTTTTPTPNATFMVVGGGHIRGVASCGVVFP